MRTTSTAAHSPCSPPPRDSPRWSRRPQRAVGRPRPTPRGNNAAARCQRPRGWGVQGAEFEGHSFSMAEAGACGHSAWDPAQKFPFGVARRVEAQRHRRGSTSGYTRFGPHHQFNDHHGADPTETLPGAASVSIKFFSGAARRWGWGAAGRTGLRGRRLWAGAFIGETAQAWSCLWARSTRLASTTRRSRTGEPTTRWKPARTTAPTTPANFAVSRPLTSQINLKGLDRLLLVRRPQRPGRGCGNPAEVAARRARA
jgi:hypothetical protein